MNWNELKITTTSEATELVAQLLIEAGSHGVSIEDPQDAVLCDNSFGCITPDSQELYPEQSVSVSGYFHESIILNDVREHLQLHLDQLTAQNVLTGMERISVTTVTDEDWATAWKQYYHPVRITRFLTIVPSWESYQPATDDEKLIVLDPGMAFGTGTHPTTQLSLVALEQVMRGGETVLDVGTGSGVLSIAACALGAGSVYAYDLDEAATRVAQENIALNPYAATVTVQANDLLHQVNRPAHIIVANILADILLGLVEDAYHNLLPQGVLILSGIIENRYAVIRDAVLAVGFTIEQKLEQKEWITVICRKESEEG